MFAVCALAPPAQAAYRYWGYWLGTPDQAQQWTFASVGPAFRTPADGTVEGWRFAVASLQSSTPPAIAPDFDAICGPTPVRDGRKRVALIVDPGGASDAPEGQQPPGAWAMCVSAEPGANGMEILRSAADVRLDRGFVCAVAGYPTRECAPSAAEPTPTPRPTDSKKSQRPTAPAPQPNSRPADPPTPQGSSGPLTPPPVPTAAATATSTAAAPPPASPAASESRESPTSGSSTTATSVPAAEASVSTEPTRGMITLTAEPSPSPSYSLLATPLTAPGDGDGGSTAALITVLAIAAIGVLGFAALVRGRRQP